MVINYKKFLLTIISYSFITIYLLSISFRFPLVGIEVEQVHNNWTIKSFSYPEWAELNSIEQGDIILEVDKQAITPQNDLTNYTIISANTILVKNNQGKLVTIQAKHSDLPEQFLHTILIPFVYSLLNITLCIYLYLYKRTSFQYLNIFMHFILTVSLTYSSIGPATQLNRFAIFLMSNGLLLSLILLIYFLLKYLKSLTLTISLILKPIFLFGLMSIICLLTLLEMVIPSIRSTNTVILLATFCTLLLYAVFMLGFAYLKYRKQQILLLFLCLIAPFLPAVFLYTLPMLLFNQYVLSASVCALFLLFIPISLVSTQFPERLFDLEYQISKIRYYSLFSSIITFLVCAGMYYIIHVKIKDLLFIFLFVWIVLIVAFYFKEKMDYTNRRVLYSPKGDYIHLIYKTIESIRKVGTVEELLKRFTKELKQQLAVSNINVYRYSVVGQMIENNNSISININLVEQLFLGEIKKIDNRYIGCLHQTLKEKYILIIEDKGGTYLKKEELLSLELLMKYISSFIENTQIVEDLVKQLETTQQLGKEYPSWLKKLVWFQLEKEKYQLSQELHDTILQEQIHLIRDLDMIQNKQEISEVKQLIQKHREYLVDLTQNLRLYCTELRPTLLEKQGLQAALDKLFSETERRADFALIVDIEDIAIENADFPLFIYRIIQELLNNAIKHSEATYIKIELTKIPHGFELIYFDNGIGCDLSKIEETESMGLQGIRERVHVYDGSIHIETAPDEGMYIHVKMEDDNFND